jgi:tetratricopeptide (TPR) repeat protein
VTAVASVRALIDDQSVSAIARATAIAALGNAATPESLAVIRPQLGAADPMIRLGAVQALSGVPLPQRAPLLIHRLRDDSRAVRLALAPLLAGSDRAALTIEQRRDLDAVFAEYRQWLTANADRAEALVALAGFHLAEGDLAAARAAFEKALQRDETSLVAYLNYADYHRSMTNDREAEVLLRRALGLYPDSANARFALGLLLVRQKRLTLALPELRRATELAPANSYFAYVYAVGLYSAGQARQALSLLGQARARFPANRQIPAALQAYCADQRGKRDVRADVLAGACR